jgi:hypothetical protein
MNPSDRSPARFIWGSGVVFSIFLLGATAAPAKLGRIESTGRDLEWRVPGK